MQTERADWFVLWSALCSLRAVLVQLERSDQVEMMLETKESYGLLTPCQHVVAMVVRQAQFGSTDR